MSSIEKMAFAQLLTCGTILEVRSGDEARIACEVGASALIVVPVFAADLRDAPRVVPMSDPIVIAEVLDAATVPVGVAVRCGHSLEAEIAAKSGAAFLVESLVLVPEVCDAPIDLHALSIPTLVFISSLYDAKNAINRGAAILATRGDFGSGDIRIAAAILRSIFSDCEAENHRLSFPIFGAGGVSTPADAAMLVRLGAAGVLAGSSVWRSENPEARMRAIVEGVFFAEESEKLLAISAGM